MVADPGSLAANDAAIRAFATRGATAARYHLITPPNRALSVLPGLSGMTVCKLLTPRRAPARFAQYLLSIEPGGGTTGGARDASAGFEHFLYGLAGGAETRVGGERHILAPGRFAYLAAGHRFELRNASETSAEVLWIKRRYQSAPGLEPPPSVAGDRATLTEIDYSPGLWRTELIAQEDPRYDFTMVRMRFEPGADMGMVEIHDEEHGLYMTAGGGLYLLDRDVHRVQQDDFIYMAPYCPQSFLADAEIGGEYLLYKDVFRDGF